VEADIFTHGHNRVGAVVKYRLEGHSAWTEVAMRESESDHWTAVFHVQQPGIHHYTIEAWVDPFQSWWTTLNAKAAAQLDILMDLERGKHLLDQIATTASNEDAESLRYWTRDSKSQEFLAEILRDDRLYSELAELTSKYRDRTRSQEYPLLQMIVDPPLARFGAWYEVFPRSCASEPGRHGKLRDLARILPRLADRGFDVVYMPPIHPIGRTARKGKNNAVRAESGDPGSPWAVGAAEGGHKAVHPELGTLEDFRFLIATARDLGLEIALDMVAHCSPDHPYVHEHPEWFCKRLDGSIECAEDPPHRYEDVYPLNFETPQWSSLWEEFLGVFQFWIELGVRVFRVDNPHTKPFEFWRWIIMNLKGRWPELIFLSEGLTRPNAMIQLARLGFTQSYDYFPWRNTKQELTEYYRHLGRSELREFFRPSLWPNTPQHLPPLLQHGGRPAFTMRLILAATLGATYGIYGPVYELCENRSTGANSVEYLDSEQYELKCWNWEAPDSLNDLVTRLNKIRRTNPALQANDRLSFHFVDNEQIIAYSKTSEDKTNVILMIVNLDPHHTQSGWTSLNLAELGLESEDCYTAHDLLTDANYPWCGSRNYVELNPDICPAHVLRVEARNS
jgi:starch synthase (maltosyl-transferring)